MNKRTLAFGCAAAAFAVNLVCERMLMAVADSFVIVPGLADFHQAWNRGVSFSLFSQNEADGRHLLMALLAGIIVAVAVMAWRAATALAAAGYGLILGGALGNLADRAMHGAVFDFLFLHLAALPLFVCNLADIAISAGVVLLAADSFMAKPRSS